MHDMPYRLDALVLRMGAESFPVMPVRQAATPPRDTCPLAGIEGRRQSSLQG